MNTDTQIESIRIGPDDPLYRAVVDKALYYKENYPRLQRIKARWDPRNVFRHALSIRADRAG